MKFICGYIRFAKFYYPMLFFNTIIIIPCQTYAINSKTNDYIQRLQDPNPAVRKEAINYFRGIDNIDIAAKKAIELRLQDKERDVRLVAVAAMSEMESISKSAITALFDIYLHDPSGAISSLAHSALSRNPIPKQALEPYIQALRGNDISTRQDTVALIENLGPAAKEILPELVEVCGADDNYYVRLHAVRAVSKMAEGGIKEATDILSRWLQDPDISIRNEARLTLEKVTQSALVKDSSPRHFADSHIPIWVGLIKGNGIVPLARLSNGIWIKTWSAYYDSKLSEIELDNLPKLWLNGAGEIPREWTIYNNDGTERQIRVGNMLEKHKFDCGQGWELQYTVKRDGDLFAVTGNRLPIQFANRLENESKDNKKLKTFIEQSFQRFEKQNLDLQPNPDEYVYDRGWIAPNQVSREEHPFTKFVIYEVTKAEVENQHIRLLYFMVRKEYEVEYKTKTTTKNMLTISLLKGWIKEDKEGNYSLNNEAYGFFEVDANREDYITPIVNITMENRKILVFKIGGYEYAGYSINELKNSGNIQTLLEIEDSYRCSNEYMDYKRRN